MCLRSMGFVTECYIQVYIPINVPTSENNHTKSLAIVTFVDGRNAFGDIPERGFQQQLQCINKATMESDGLA